MFKRINVMINYSICFTLLFFLMGMILIVFPQLSSLIVSNVMGCCFIILGIFLLFLYSNKSFYLNISLFGVLEIVFGFIMILYPRVFNVLFPVLLGTWMILKSYIDLKLGFLLRECKIFDWKYVIILSLLAILCGIMLIINIKIGHIVLTVVIGLFLTSYSLTSIINGLIFKQNIKIISKKLNEYKEV